MFGSKINEDVLFIDNNPQIGVKIKVSGGGKCNITNEFVSPKNYQGDKEFISYALEKFSQKDTLSFFKKHEVIPHIRENGQYFCNSSKDVLKSLHEENKTNTFLLNTSVKSVEFKDSCFIIKCSNNQIIVANKVVVASGGISYKNLGATGIGYEIAQNFGHKIQTPLPALVGLSVQKEQFWMRELSGISCEVKLTCKEHSYVGNLLFSHKGISGPAVLSTSLRWENGSIFIDFLPYMEFKKDSKIWQEKKQLTSLLQLPKRFIKEFLNSLVLEDKVMKNYTNDERSKILLFKNYKMSPAGTFGMTKAEITKGGVCTDEINQKTFESNIQKGLYFIGEVLDVSGELGGYNIQWAFSSGALCAKNII